MVRQANRTDVLWGYAAQLLNVGSGLLLLPVALHYLNSNELGVWYVFIALAGLAQLLEFGFQPTIARQTAYVYAGAKNLAATGLPVNRAEEVNLPLLLELLAAARKVYRFVALGAIFVLFGIGSIYLYTLSSSQFNSVEILLPWLVYATGSILNFYYGYYNGLLQGRGEQTAANKLMTASRGFMVLISVPLLISGLGLMGLALANVASAAVSRVLAVRAFYNASRPETRYLQSHHTKSAPLTSLLWHSAWRLGIVQLGAFMILRANQFIASSFLGLPVAASYGLTLQLLGLLSTMASMLATLQMPRMNALQAKEDKEELRTLYASSLLGSWIVYVIGSFILLFIGLPILQYLKSNTLLIPMPWLIVMMIIMLLEMNHAISAAYITTLNKVPFMYASIFSGIGIIIFGFGLIHFTTQGIGALVIAQGLIQLLYNNWKWPRTAARHLDFNLSDLITHGIKGLKRLARA